MFLNISGAQKGWSPQAGNKPEGSEQIYCGGALQDGGFPHGEGFNKTRGLVSQNRPEECLLLGTGSPQSPEIPSVSMAGQTVPVLVSAFRPILCPSYLHKTDETGGSPSEGEGNQTHCIPGRHIDPVQLSGHPNQPVEICQGPVSGAGPSHQREEISATGGVDPSQEIVFLGLAISTTTMQVSLPKEKVARIQQEAKQLQAMSEVSVQKLAMLVGRTTAAKQAIRVAPLFHRHLQALINRVVPLASSIEEVKQCYHQMVELSVEARQELVWWIQEMQEHNGAPLTMGTPDMVIESDASGVQP